MPTYEYECQKCKKHFDVFQKMSDEPVKVCPKCGGKAERLIGFGSGVIFKGSGFYETDYKKRSKSEKDKAACDAPKSGGCKGCSLNKKDG